MAVIENIINNPEAVVNLLAFLGAIVLGIWGYLSNQKRARVLHTIDMSLSISSNEKLVDANYTVHRYIVDNEKCSLDNLDEQTQKSIFILFNYYHMMAQAALDQNIDVRSFLSHRYGSMKQHWVYFHDFIQHRRDQLKRPNYWKEIDECIKKYDAYYQRLEKH